MWYIICISLIALSVLTQSIGLNMLCYLHSVVLFVWYCFDWFRGRFMQTQSKRTKKKRNKSDNQCIVMAFIVDCTDQNCVIKMVAVVTIHKCHQTWNDCCHNVANEKCGMCLCEIVFKCSCVNSVSALNRYVSNFQNTNKNNPSSNGKWEEQKRKNQNKL